MLIPQLPRISDSEMPSVFGILHISDSWEPQDKHYGTCIF